ncbi:RHS repeat-associated core domain-containing protein [Burkholderia alba]|uniref:RHS repeat-associated core domain-containing protein n=1 Tax=Burkholderia alba TaxID=2683677 RepID=UPI002B056468|nr:RHS repeat-associated core domain-containing protein [Burkholderia alba]
MSLDVLADPTYRILNVVIASLGQRWYGDQLVNNTVIVTRGLNGEVFVALPDGTYNPPPGNSARLLKNADGTYSYESVHRGLLKFNAAGKAESYIDPNGIQIRYSYSGNDLTQVQNSLGRTLSFTMAGGRITKVGDGVSTVGYGYDGNANLTTFTDPSGKNTTFAYAQPGQMSGLFYPSFPTVSVATNVYDSLGRVKTQTNARGKTYEYYFAGSRTEEVAPGNISRTRYIDSLGNVVQSSTPLSNYTVNTYDGLARLIKAQYPENNGTTYSYDDATCAGPDKRCTNNIKTVSKVTAPGTNVAPLTQSFTYEGKFNQVATATDARGNVTSYTYTDQGQPWTVTSPTVAGGVSPVTTYGYTTFTPNGYPAFVLPSTTTVKINGNGDATTTSTSYNSGNYYVPSASVVDSGAGRLNLTTRFSYDSVGNVIEVNGPRTDVAQVVKYQYDANRRVVRVIDGLGKETRTTYDADGRPTTQASQLGSQWLVSCTQYSATGRVIRAWGPGLTGSASTCPASVVPTSVTDTAYDDLERVSRITQYLPDAQGGNRVTATAYFNDDTVQSVSKAVGTPLAQAYATFTYSPNGNVTSVKDARSYATVYAYDGFDRLIRTYYPLPGSPNLGNQNDYEETGYDANSNATSLRRRSGAIITQGWDNLNRLISRTYPTSSDSVLFDYDLRGLRTGARFVSGANPITYSWDNAGRLTSTSADGRTLSYLYDQAGNRIRLTWPDGFYTTTSYDALNRPGQIKENDRVLLAQYAYDDLGRRTTVTLGNGTRTERQYDNQGAMSSLAHVLTTTPMNVQFTYTRNQVGDLTQINVSNSLYQWAGGTPSTQSYAANGLNQYTSIPGGTPTYDPNGNLATDGARTYTYGTDVRLKAVSGAGVQATLAYDPIVRLRQTVINGTATQLLYDSDALVAEYDATGGLQKRYVPGPGVDETIVRYDGTGTAGKTWFYADQLGSVVGVADPAGAGLGAYQYGPFGETGTTNAGRFGYTGQQYIAELGLYYYKARIYSPALGRFLQTDPSGTTDDLNLYAYVGNNSINRIDPSGLQSTIRGNGVQVACNGGNCGFTDALRTWADRSIAGFKSDSLSDFASRTLDGLPMGGVAIGAIGALKGAGAATQETTALFRAVGPAELADIQATGVLRNLGSAEGKYFTTSAEQAASYAKQAVKGFGDQPYTIIRTEVPYDTFKGLMPATVDRGIPAWVLPSERLQGLTPKIINYSPLPPNRY